MELAVITPKAEQTVQKNKNFQFISTAELKSPKKPKVVVMDITNNDVAIAFVSWIPVVKMRAGTIKKPPPAPTNPVTKPIPAPCKMFLI